MSKVALHLPDDGDGFVEVDAAAVPLVGDVVEVAGFDGKVVAYRVVGRRWRYYSEIAPDCRLDGEKIK